MSEAKSETDRRACDPAFVTGKLRWQKTFSAIRRLLYWGMTKDQVKTILDRVLTWPEERQRDAAEMLALMEEQDKAPLRLTDEQVAEVKRRLADPNPKFLTLEEVRERFARRNA